MRTTIKLFTIILLLLTISSLMAKKKVSTEIRGKARLDKYDIPFTEESFFKYLHLDNGEVISDFLIAGYKPDLRDEKYDPVLLVAAEKNYLNAAEALLKGGACPDSTDWDGTTPLMYACFEQNTKMVKLLLKYKANINLQNKAGYTALMFAIKGGNGSTIDEVLTKKTNLDLKNEKGMTAKDLALSLKYYYLANYMGDKVDFLNGRYYGKTRFNTVKLQDL